MMTFRCTHYIGTSGVTYIRWGRTACEDNGATLLYSGKPLHYFGFQLVANSAYSSIPTPLLERVSSATASTYMSSSWIRSHSTTCSGANYANSWQSTLGI